MSHRHADEETPAAPSQNNEIGTRRQPSHAHLNLKPAHVIDQIKTKVKRKRPSSKLVSDAITVTVDDSSNENNEMPFRSSDKHNRLNLPTVSLTKARSQPNIALEASSAEDANAQLGSKSTDEQYASTENIPFVLEESNTGSKNRLAPPQDKSQASSDAETGKKRSKSKSKSSKEPKAGSELSTQPDDKKQRHKSRRTVESTPKKSKSKGHKEAGSENMTTLPYLAAFQVRDEEFNNIFNELPADEQLLVAYQCIWRKDVYTHGRIFLTINHVCFFTCFFQCEEKISIPLKDIVSIKREKSVKVLSNAISLRTKTNEEYIFASFTPRKHIFSAITRLWKNALLDHPVGYQQMRATFATEQPSGNESSGDSDEPGQLVNGDVHPADRYCQSQWNTPCRTSNSIPVLTLSEETEPAEYRSTCSCESHFARMHADRTLSCHVDTLFELIFEDNAFSRAYHDSQKLKDFSYGEWQVNSETGKRVRQTTYKVVSQSMFGTNTITCTDKQTVEAEIPHTMYVVKTEVYNEGVKYTDAFFVATKYCMFQRDAKTCGLRVSAEIKYIKSINGIIKGIIEKSCNSSIEEGLANLVRRLESQQSAAIPRRLQQRAPLSVSKEQHARPKEDEEESPTSSEPKLECVSVPSENVTAPSHEVSAGAKPTARSRILFNIALGIGVLLLLLHFYLCYKLYSIDQLLQNPAERCQAHCRKGCGVKKART